MRLAVRATVENCFAKIEIDTNILHQMQETQINSVTFNILKKTTCCSVPYEALSYTWGNEESPENISLDDGVLSVTRNLADALFFLRRKNSTRTLWIDALCINQADLVEKGRQVRNMHRIYEHADQVVVW